MAAQDEAPVEVDQPAAEAGKVEADAKKAVKPAKKAEAAGSSTASPATGSSAEFAPAPRPGPLPDKEGRPPPPSGDVVAEDDEEEPRLEDEDEEPFPELKVERTTSGMWKAVDSGWEAMRRGDARRDAGEHQAAKAAYEECIGWWTKFIWVAGKLPHLVEVEGEKPVAQQLSIWHGNRSLPLFELGRWKEAEEDCSEAIRLERRNKKAYARRAKARYNLGMLEEARRDIMDHCWSLGSPTVDDPAGAGDLRALREQIMAEKERLEALEKEKQRIETEERRKSGEPWPELSLEGGLHGMEGLQTARSKASSAMCEAGRVAWNVGGHYAAEGCHNQAVKWLDKAIWLASTGQASGVTDELRCDLHYSRANALSRLGRNREAEAECSEALALNGQHVMAHFRRAEARFNIGSAKGALQDIEEVLKAEPEGTDHRKAIDEMAYRERLGSLTEFKESIEELIKKQADLPAGVVTLKNAVSGCYLHVSPGSTSIGDPVLHTDDSASDGSKWHIEHDGDTGLRIMLKSVLSGHCICMHPDEGWNSPRTKRGRSGNPVFQGDSGLWTIEHVECSKGSGKWITLECWASKFHLNVSRTKPGSEEQHKGSVCIGSQVFHIDDKSVFHTDSRTFDRDAGKWIISDGSKWLVEYQVATSGSGSGSGSGLGSGS